MSAHQFQLYINREQGLGVYMQANSTRREDWLRFWKAITGESDERRNPNPYLNYILLVLHTGKNIIVEEARRHGWELRPSKWR